jgi:hypothetical protein
VTKLKLELLHGDTGHSVIFRALANNRSLMHLDLHHLLILCQSLQAHPSVIILDLIGGRNVLADERKAHRTRAIADIMQQNTVLHTIALLEREWEPQIYAEEILPHLETNLYRPRVLAVKKTTERPFREKVLGRALDSGKCSPNLVWMFLSENVDAFVRSREEE